MKNRTVLISGAGVAGPTLAFWLKAGGYEPTLVERAPSLRTGGYVIDFWGLGYDVAELMRIDTDPVAYHVEELRIVDDCGKRVSGFDVDVFRQLTRGRYVTLARSDLSRLIFESMARSEVRFDDEIVELQDRGDRVRVQFKRGGGREFDFVVAPMDCIPRSADLPSVRSDNLNEGWATWLRPSKRMDTGLATRTFT